MTIKDLVLKGTHKSSAGSNGSWRVFEDEIDGKVTVRILYHYDHRMLRWNRDNPTDPEHLDYSTGWGSVSDQGGMNTAFRTLGIPLYFSRNGGARIA